LLDIDGFDDILKVLNKSKPFIISESRWEKFRHDLIHSKRSSRNSLHISNLSDDESFKVLNAQKTEKISAMEWDYLIDIMSKRFVEAYKHQLKTSLYIDDLEKLIKIPFPINLPEIYSNELTKLTNSEFYTVNKLSRYSHFSNVDSTLKLMNRAHPASMEGSELQNYVEALENKYTYEVLKDITEKFFIARSDISDYDLTKLSAKRQNEIKDFFYKVKLSNLDAITSEYTAEKFLEMKGLEWLKEVDLKRLKSIANSYVNLKVREVNSDLKQKGLNRLIGGLTLNDRVEFEGINDADWDKLKVMEENIVKIANENSKSKVEIQKDKAEVGKVKSQVLKQLDCISKTLSRPEAAFEIEDYDNAFSCGNFENLKRVSKHLTSLEAPQ
jgi:hypothetical protein